MLTEAEKEAIGEVMDDLCRLSDLASDSMDLCVKELPICARLDEAIDALDKIIRPGTEDRPRRSVHPNDEVGKRTPIQWDDSMG